mgnify:CR=1 FL=1
MKLPAKIKVGGLDFRVEAWAQPSARGSQRFGEFSAAEELIRVQVADRSPMFVLEVLLHEIVHAIWWVGGLRNGDDEERCAQVMGPAWAQIFRDNPELVAFIQDSVRG